MPIHIKHDSATTTFLENSFKNLKFFLCHDFPHGGDEESYQTFAVFKSDKFQEFLKSFNFTNERPLFIHFYENQTDALENYTILNDEIAKDIKEIKLSDITYEDLLKFDTFKIMP